jgi:small-conductance mechanosensitive channel
MNLYNVIDLEKQIDNIAEKNEGELPEDLLEELINQQTQSLIHIENLCQYIKTIEYKIEACKTEEERIKNLREKAQNHINKIKSYLTPYIEKQKKIETNTFTLSIRKSKRVDLIDGFNNLEYCNVKEVVTPDKTAIKKAIEQGKKIEGAKLVENNNLQIK